MLNTKLKMMSLFVVAAGLVIGTNAQSAVAGQKELVSFRLTKWKTIHFDDTKKADAHYTTIKKLGCEVKKESHGDHTDVSYRCPKWRQMALKTHKSAHQWERWLKASGFETKHEH